MCDGLIRFLLVVPSLLQSVIITIIIITVSMTIFHRMVTNRTTIRTWYHKSVTYFWGVRPNFFEKWQFFLKLFTFSHQKCDWSPFGGVYQVQVFLSTIPEGTWTNFWSSWWWTHWVAAFSMLVNEDTWQSSWSSWWSFMQICHNWYPLNTDSVHEVNESEKLYLKLCADQSASLLGITLMWHRGFRFLVMITKVVVS